MNSLTPSSPFVLFEDMRSEGASGRFFTSPVRVVSAHSLEEVPAALEAVREALGAELSAAGWLGYEAGLAFEPRLMVAQRPDAARLPLLWFGLFDKVERPSSAEVEGALPDAAGAWLSPPRPRMNRDAYDAAFERARQYIIAGDIYQVNLSYRADVTVLGDPLAAYARLRKTGKGGWSGVVFDGANWLLSTSPELFFRLSQGAIEARPMKGTAPRDDDPEADMMAARGLRNDPKEIAENLMIVDLLRSDISRLAERGSVHVPELFSVETYPTLHTLTSTVRAKVRAEHDCLDVLGALFPCGSVTGAPKIRAMEIIAELEADQRGPYTGSIGWIGPDGSAEFNVAIRTLALGGAGAELGLGSAVVFDSQNEREWRECETKGAFLTADAPEFELIETMGYAAGEGVRYVDLHLARLERSARTFGFAFSAKDFHGALTKATHGVAEPCALRLTLASDGRIDVTPRPMPVLPEGGFADVQLAPLPVAAADFRLRHKTTARAFYDDARARSGAFEVLFFDPDGFVTEGSFTNVFVKRGGVLVTPPASRALLPGVLRQALLDQGAAKEDDIRPEELSRGFYIGNALRGLLPARLVDERLVKQV